MSLGEEGSSPSTDRLTPKTCETVVTNEREVVRLIKMVRPKWKRADLILQVCFWGFGALTSVFVFFLFFFSADFLTLLKPRMGCL